MLSAYVYQITYKTGEVEEVECSEMIESDEFYTFHAEGKAREIKKDETEKCVMLTFRPFYA